MCDHYGRSERDKKGLEKVARSNENIDPTRTHLNYNIATHQELDQVEFIKKRTSEVHCLKRKDVNVMCSWVVTAPKDVAESEYNRFFKASYDFLEQKYGKENIVSAFVHMDEITPHMHFAFIPVVKDKKKDRLKVSAKECVTRRDLRAFHDELSKHISAELGREVAILNGATKDGNKSIADLKRGEARKKMYQAERNFEKAKEIMQEVTEKKAEAENSLKTSENALKSVLKQKKDIEYKLKETDEIQGKKGLLGGITLKADDFDRLKALASKNVPLNHENKRLRSENKELVAENQKLNAELEEYRPKKSLQFRIKDVQERSNIKHLEEKINLYEKIISLIPKNILAEIQQKLGIKVKSKNRGMER